MVMVKKKVVKKVAKKVAKKVPTKKQAPPPTAKKKIAKKVAKKIAKKVAKKAAASAPVDSTPNTQQSDVYASVSVESKDNPALNKHEQVPYATVQQLEVDPHAMVGVSLGFTLSTGDFESVRGHVELHVPCPVQHVPKAYKQARKFVDEKLGELREECTALVTND